MRWAGLWSGVGSSGVGKAAAGIEQCGQGLSTGDRVGWAGLRDRTDRGGHLCSGTEPGQWGLSSRDGVG